jgi:GDP-4-dehydro-6-deoxy-D-mannose reductase
VKVLITGASGFVGRHLVAGLPAAMPQAELLAVRGPSGEGEGPRLDLTDEDATHALIETFAPDMIVHLAAQSSVGHGVYPPEVVWRANFDGTRALAEAGRRLAERRGFPVRFIFASSAEVYGTQFNNGPCDENAGFSPRSVYGRTKAACELALNDLAGPDLRVTALRLFNHTGPGQDARFVVPALALRVAALPPGDVGPIPVGNLQARRDFTDIADIIDAYLTVMKHDDRPQDPAFSAFNVGSGVTRTMQSIVDRLAELRGSPVEVRRESVMLRPGEILVTEGKFARFTETYGWHPTRSFDDTIRHMLEYAKSRDASGVLL